MLHPSSLQAMMTMTLSNLVRVMCWNPDPVHYGPKKIDEQHVVNSMQQQQQQDCHFKRALVRLEPLLLLMVPQRFLHLLLQRTIKLLALQTSWACFNLRSYACFSLYFLPNSCHSFFLLFIYLFFERAAANQEEPMYTVCSNC